MSFILRILSWALGRNRGPVVHWRPANENTATKASRRVKKAPRRPPLAHMMAHGLPVTLLGRSPALGLWNLSDPARVALLYLQHGRRMRLPSPSTLSEFGKAVQRGRSAE